MKPNKSVIGNQQRLSGVSKSKEKRAESSSPPFLLFEKNTKLNSSSLFLTDS